MKKTFKLLSALLFMVGCYQVQLPQTIAGTKSGANQIEKKALPQSDQEENLDNPKFVEFCRVHERYPGCNPLTPRMPRKFSRTLGHVE